MTENSESHLTSTEAKGIVARWQSWAPQIRGLLRIVAAMMFMSAGTMKLFGVPSMPARMPIPLVSELGLAGTLEVFGGVLILLGLFTRPVAFILAGEMAVAYFQAHFPKGPWPTMNGGQPAVLYCFLWLYYSAAGAGGLSIDALIRARKRASIRA